MERSQFTFYESFYRAISFLDDDSAARAAYEAICQYALYGTEPDVENMPRTAASIFLLSKPNLDSSRRKAESGKVGGERKQTESKPQANEKQTASEIEKEIEVEKEIETEYESKPPVVPRKTTKAKKVSPEKVQFAEFVFMTNDEHEKLLATHGAADTAKLVEILNNYKGASGKTYASDYRAILSWCVDRLAESRSKGEKSAATGQKAALSAAQSADDRRRYASGDAMGDLERMRKYAEQMRRERDEQTGRSQ